MEQAATSGNQGDWESDESVLRWISTAHEWVDARTLSLRRQHIQAQIASFARDDPRAVVDGVLAMIDNLPADRREGVVATLKQALGGSAPAFPGPSSLAKAATTQ